MLLGKDNPRQSKLKVQEALQEEAYKGIVRIDSQTMRQIGVRAGDILEIEGGRATVGIVDRAYPTDIGQSIIRMDGILRRNARTGIGELVTVRAADIKEAKSLVIAPAQHGVMIQADPALFKKGLLGRPVSKGDIVALGGTRSRRRTMAGSPFEDIFDVFEQGFMGNFGFGSLKFIVADATPKQPVIITENTDIRISSKTVEVSEEAHVPEVTYEDIGGLEDEVKKLREMVELPLRHPEIFERLGVEPPKGVLLHGPPGTGKTLIAKAVANESDANFILVNGPELTCVSGDTEVLTNPNGREKIENIFNEAYKTGEIVAKDDQKEIIIPKNPIKVFSLNKNFEIVPDKVKSLTRVKKDSTLKIQTKKKADITTSRNHPFATLDHEGNLKWAMAKDLKVGDYVAIASHIKANKNNPVIKWWKSLDKDNTFIKLNNKEKRLKDVKDIKKITGIKHAILKSNIERAKFIKPIFKITPKFAEFIGLMYSEGYIGFDEVCITGENKELLNYYTDFFKDLFGFTKDRITVKYGRHGKAVVYSTILAELLTKGFGLPRNKKPKDAKLPNWLFKCNKETIASFIKGYYYGDGSQAWIKEKYPSPAIYSANKEFLKDMQILLLNLSIISKITTSQTGMGNILHALEILDTEGREKFYDLLNLDFKKEVFEKWLSIRTKTGSSEVIPNLAPLLHKLKTNLKLTYNKEIPEINFEPVISGRFPLTFRNAKRVLNIFEENFKKKIKTLSKENVKEIKEQLSRLKRIISSDLKWDKITKIEQTGPKMLYDLSMSNYSNFFAGSPLTLLHNSKFYGETEKRVREIFQEAEKNAPSIIFIDEIDSVAPKREETYGEVERRMVSQLLTMMDGLKGRGKVVVIGATNRVNALDPALRRPGRFDREISIGVPNKKGRLNILKIHTRNMPIEGSIYGGILEKKIWPTIEQKSRDLDGNIDRKKEEIKELESKLVELNREKQSADSSFLNKIIVSINRLNQKHEKINEEIKENKTNLSDLKKIKERLLKDKQEFKKLVEQIKNVDEAKRIYFPTDPRLDIVLNNVGDVYRKLESVDIVNEVIDKTKQAGIAKDLEKLAEVTHGFVGADISALAKEAAMSALRRVLPSMNLKETEQFPKEFLDKLSITDKDFKDALKLVRPSALREVLIESPSVHWEDIGGLDNLKQELKEAVEWPLKHPHVFTAMGIRAPRGILLYGPPGTGKTQIAKAVASESESNFIYIKGPELISKWVGESERGIRKIFEKARQASPCIIFFDEIDAIAHQRGTDESSKATERVVNQLLTEMDGLEELHDVVVIAATNRVDMMDPGLLRPGRFDKLLATKVPNEKARESIFKIHTRNMPLADDVKKSELAKRTPSYTGADIEGVCREAALIALRKNIESRKVEMKNFEEALEKIKPSVGEEDLKKYGEMEEDYIKRARAAIQKVPSYLG